MVHIGPRIAGPIARDLSHLRVRGTQRPEEDSMRSIAIALTALVMSASPSAAGDLQKPYFGATPPGSWVTSESSHQMSDGTKSRHVSTYTRLADRDGRVLIELELDVVEGPGAGTTTRQLYVMGPGFDLAQNRLSFGKWLEAIVIQSGDMTPIVQTGDMLRIVRDAMLDYRGAMTFGGPDTADGRDCDRYQYAVATTGSYPMTYQGELWLDASIPFGVVQDHGEAHDAATGELMTTSETHLVDFGTGRSGTPALIAALPDTEPRDPSAEGARTVEAVSLRRAFEEGAAELQVTVREDHRVSLVLTNRTDQPLRVTLPEGQTDLSVGSPLGTLSLLADSEQVIALDGRGTGDPVHVAQAGRRGAVQGSFRILTYEGDPLLTGSVTVGALDR